MSSKAERLTVCELSNTIRFLCVSSLATTCARHGLTDLLFQNSIIFNSLCYKISIFFTVLQGWKPGYLALGCQFQFRCVETQMSGFSLGLVSRLLKNRFQFCLRTTSVSGFEFWFKFHSKKLFYFEYGFF